MKDYRSLPDNHLWTLTALPGNGQDGMTISDDSATFHLTVMPYLEDVYQDILAQAARYDVVEDRRFAGIFTLCSDVEESFMHTIRRDCYKGLLFTDGTTVGINRDQFEGSPGGFRYTCDYSLKKDDRRL